MSFENIRTVFRKEIRETLRDRRTILVMLVLPIFLYPVLMVVIQQLVLIGQRSIEDEPAQIAVVGASPATMRFLQQDSALSPTAAAMPPLDSLRTGGVDAVIVLSDTAGGEGRSQSAVVYFDASEDRSRRAREVVEGRLSEWNDTLLAGRLRARGLPEAFATPVVVSDSSIASAEQLGGYALGRFLPSLLIIMTLLGAFFPAIDLTAGEKERGTLETLLTTAVPARDIVAGKFLTVCVTAMATASLNMLSMLLTFESGVFQIAQASEIEFGIPLSTGLLLLLLMVPLAVFFAAISLGLSVRTQSFKEAQNQLTPVQFASLVPMYLPMIPGITLSYSVALVPIGGVAVLFRDLMGGNVDVGPAVVAVAAMIGYAALALRFATRMFGREDVLFGSGSGAKETVPVRARIASWRVGEKRLPRAAESLALVAVIALLYFYLGTRLRVVGMERGLFAAQWLLLCLPAVLFAFLGPFRPAGALAARMPAPRALIASTMIIAGGQPIGWMIGWLQGLWLEIPTEYLETFQRLLQAESAGRFAWLILLIAVTPAICEELVFRGVLLQGLSTELSKWRAIVLSAVVFGAFHLSYETVIRFLPTAWLGLLMAFVVWHTRSIFNSMLMHFLNNASAVVLVTTTGLQSYLFGPTGVPKVVPMAAAALLLGGGIYLLPKRSEMAGEGDGVRR